jgi:hypothetical protein
LELYYMFKLLKKLKLFKQYITLGNDFKFIEKYNVDSENVSCRVRKS